MVPYLTEEVARQFFGSRNAFMVTATGAVGTAVPTEGGYRVTGRWPYGSGIHGASSVAGLCAIPGENEHPKQLMCLAPVGMASVFDTWHVSGLRGTGSCDWTLEDVFVPEAHTFRFPDQRAMQPGLIYRMPVISTFVWSVSVIPVALAKACIKAFLSVACGRVRVGTSQPLGERETIQSEVGRADALLRAARALVCEKRRAVIRHLDALNLGHPLVCRRAAPLHQVAQLSIPGERVGASRRSVSGQSCCSPILGEPAGKRRSIWALQTGEHFDHVIPAAGALAFL